jgi:hypothetical protein
MIHKTLKAAIGVLALALSTASFGDESPDPDEVHINGIVFAGSGCPGGSAGVYLSDDALAFTIAFDEFYVEKGPGISLSEGRKFCNLNLDIHVPQGFQYTIFKVDYSGFADLARGTGGMLKSTYRFSGAAGRNSRATLATRLRGALVDDYAIHDNIAIASLVWSRCGVNRALNIKTEARVYGSRSKSALLTVDTIDGEFEQIYALKWRTCFLDDFDDDFWH